VSRKMTLQHIALLGYLIAQGLCLPTIALSVAASLCLAGGLAQARRARIPGPVPKKPCWCHRWHNITTLCNEAAGKPKEKDWIRIDGKIGVDLDVAILTMKIELLSGPSTLQRP